MVIKNTDIIELYSYGIFLNLNLNFMNYVMLNSNINFFKGIIYIFLFNLFTKFVFKYSFLNILFHNYWKNNLKTIAMPQLIYSSGLVLMNDLLIDNKYINNVYSKALSIIGLNYFIKNNYINEVNDSIIFRYNFAFLYFFIDYLIS
tara:strand:+ start:766 stop:1203 length:438 start_codon:yes stop_codon:yes gene_type:complete